MEFYLQSKMKNIFLLWLNIFIVMSFIYIILPSFNLDLINNNIKKDIDANVYLYTEINIEKEWSVK